MIGFYHFFVIAALVGLFILAWRFNRPEAIGRRGERMVNKRLQRLPDEYHLFYNLIVPGRKGGSTQIDHIVISPYGIFVVETKNCKGIITGNARSEKWTQNIWGNKYELYNPIIQNYAHIAALKRILPQETNGQIHNIVTFPNRTILHVFDVSEHLVHFRRLKDTIYMYNAIVLSEQTIQKICVSLQKYNVIDKERQERHKAATRRTVYVKNEKVRQGICPRCGGTLIRRSGRYGRFWGCSNYPNCRYTMK